MNQHNNIFLNFLLAQFLLLCLTLPQTVFSQPANSAWPLDRHDAKNTGYSSYAGPSNGILKWQFTLNNGGMCDCSPAISGDGTIYIPSGSNAFYALNPDGSLKWT